jgi:hypothetical protein
MTDRPYAVACAALLGGLLAGAALVTFYVGAKSVPLKLILYLIPAAVAVTAFGLTRLLIRAVTPRPADRRSSHAAYGTLAITTCLAPATVFFGVWAGRSSGFAWLNVLFAGLGVMMIVMGNAAGKLPFNPAFPADSAWAHAYEEVWDKTQRFTGWVMVIAGFVIVDAALIFDAAIVNWITLVATCGSTMLITFFSWRLARQKKKARDEAWERLAR